MAYARTITWLAVLVAIVPFLAIPSWLTKTIISILAVAIVFFSYQAYTSDQQDSQAAHFDDNQPPSSQDSDESDQSDKAGDGTDADQQQSDEPVDIEDPDADQMVAENRWRRRSSRELSEQSDKNATSAE